MAPPKLIPLTSGGPVREFLLQSGVNTIGRNEGNRHQIAHPSVSSHHCEVTWEEETVFVRDLNSTNGTFISGEKVQEGTLEPGQILRLGSVDLKLEVKWPQPPAGGLKAPVRVEIPPVAPPLPQHAGSSRVKAPVAAAGPPPPPKTFFQLVPLAFAYPISKNGVILLVAGGLIFAVLGFLSKFSFLFGLLATGYLAAYMQRVISSSAQGEPEMPDYPDLGEWWSDIISPALTLVGTILFCFGPALALLSFGDKSNPAVMAGAIGLGVAGGLYFPMAWLVVAVTDNLLSLNPLVVVTSILRVFLPYIVVCVVLGLLMGLRYGGEFLLDGVPMNWLLQPVASIVWLYLLMVEMRILGVLYFTHREKLGWFS